MRLARTAGMTSLPAWPAPSRPPQATVPILPAQSHGRSATAPGPSAPVRPMPASPPPTSGTPAAPPASGLPASSAPPRPVAPPPAASSPAAPLTTVGPYATANLDARVHPSQDVIIERFRADGRVQIQGGGQVGAQLRNGEVAATPARTGQAPGGTETQAATTYNSVPGTLLPVSFNLNDQTASASNILNTQGGTAAGALEAAIAEINTEAGQTLISPTLGSTSQRMAANDGNNIISFVQGNYRFNKSTVAVAISYLQGSSIVGSDVFFNPRQKFSTDNSGSVEQKTFDIQGVGTHELMHTLGVPHLADPGSTMYPSVSQTDDLKLRSLEPADVNELQLRYPAPTA